MVTDDERREVARMLRELPGDSTYPDLIGVIADHDGWYPASDAAGRLADLIEPSIPADPGEAGLACVDAFIRERTEKPVDREALLALAEELSGNILVVPSVYGTYQSGYVAACQDIARRIREACGEEGA